MLIEFVCFKLKVEEDEDSIGKNARTILGKDGSDIEETEYLYDFGKPVKFSMKFEPKEIFDIRPYTFKNEFGEQIEGASFNAIHELFRVTVCSSYDELKELYRILMNDLNYQTFNLGIFSVNDILKLAK